MTKATIKGPWDVHVRPSDGSFTLKRCPGLLVAQTPDSAAYRSKSKKERETEVRVWHFDDLDLAVSYVFTQQISRWAAADPYVHPSIGGVLTISQSCDSPEVRKEIDRVQQRFQVLEILGKKGKGT
jgi:hypothetical protein